ncbi:LysR substrate-binding domain-containing protein [Lentibacter sp. XHP0401]|uniref:LysR substrate-binding domain-containing protein n=1 Tax=Lentibacter sp. XHP0401 TaxID=2984334 RepID=UPI0021E8436B|nr:LysR substrate-binding domain-containing protein [Lentibacter sp. XHP0401]MCV2894961.1 LysR substrate-binding domain-containing protein [Lentibacter sp. XHP0401]
MRRTMPSTTSLACFEATFRHGSVTRAAEELNMTQSAVSRRLMELERQLGKPLFRRIRRKLVPEAAAIQYGKDLGRILSEIEAATTRFIAEGQETGLLTVAVPPTLASRWLIPRLNDFITRHPHIDLNLVSKIRRFDFDEEDIDVSVYLGDGNWPGVHMQPLMADYVVPVCSPDLIGDTRIDSAADLLKFPLIQHATRPLLWNAWFRAQKVETSKAARGPKFEFYSHAVQAATNGIGIALMSDLVVQKEIDAGSLIVPFGNRATFEDDYYFVYPHRMVNSVNAQTFGFWLQQQCAKYLVQNGNVTLTRRSA